MKKITHIEVIIETLQQPQPGMPPIHPLWKHWLLLRLRLALKEQHQMKEETR